MATNFYLESRTDKNGDAPIRVSINIAGARFVTATQHKISPDKWNAEKQRVKKGSSNAKGITYNAINNALQTICSHFATYESNCILQGKKINVDALKSEYNVHFGKKKDNQPAEQQSLTLWNVYDLFTKEMGAANQWTAATFQKFAALKKHLEGYKKRLQFSDLDEKGLNGFVAYLRDSLDMKNTTITKQLGFLKWFLRWATAKGFNDNLAFQTFSPKLKTSGKKVIFLEWAELMKLFNYEIPGNGQEVTLTDAQGKEYTKEVHDASAIAKTRDIFCFCCFTSLRYSDAANLKWSNINGDSMTITTIKTADLLTIELNKYALSILEKYKGNGSENGGFVFPSITNQRMNIYIKELCELCGINQMITQTYYKGTERIDETLPKYELIGTHAGRRTFICNALMLGIPAEIVMKWTGHSDYKAMKPYIAIADAAKAKAMDLFNKI